MEVYLHVMFVCCQTCWIFMLISNSSNNLVMTSIVKLLSHISAIDVPAFYKNNIDSQVRSLGNIKDESAFACFAYELSNLLNFGVATKD